MTMSDEYPIIDAASAWQATFDAVADAIWVLDRERRVIRCNRASERIFGKDISSFLGHFCCEAAHGSHPLPECPFQQMLETGTRASMQLIINERWYEVTVDPIRSPDGEITGAVHIVSDITDLKHTEEHYRLLMENLPVVTWHSDKAGRTRFISSNVRRIFGYTPDEIREAGDAIWPGRIHPDDRERVQAAMADLFDADGIYDLEYRIQRKDGEWIWLHDFVYTTAVRGGVRTAYGVFSDVTARKQAEAERDQLETELRQAQKMEAIGHLAGGIAHDFNNLLTPILGYAEMLGNDMPHTGQRADRVNTIISAAHKAKELTQQLLSFGRRQELSVTTVDLNEIIRTFHDIIRRTIRENIEIELLLAPETCHIRADRSQIEQIILNLTVNAQDALKEAGHIAIETCKVLMDGENARLHPGMVPGYYFLLSFSDNGCGIPPEVMDHIFEPFFTTKQTGHGTGLGLATVYGIVKQHGGHISVISKEGHGTTFRIYLPVCESASDQAETTYLAGPVARTGNGTILVVEDNAMVCQLVRDMLQGGGYTVMTAPDPHNAILMAAEQRERINLLVSDVVMPGLSGPELYERLLLTLPHLKAVFMSGYPVNPSLRGGALEAEVNYLQKPFSYDVLLERVSRMLA
jgi:PAS domain S-box-containing protein